MDNTRWRWVRGTGQKWNFCDVLARAKAAMAIVCYKTNFTKTEKCVSQSSKWRWPVLDIELTLVTFSGIVGFPPRARVW